MRFGYDVDKRVSAAFQLFQNEMQAQKIRSRLLCHMRRIFQEVDFIATPTVGITAPELRYSSFTVLYLMVLYVISYCLRLICHLTSSLLVVGRSLAAHISKCNATHACHTVRATFNSAS